MTTDTFITYVPVVLGNPPVVCGEILTDTTWLAFGGPYQVTCDVTEAAGVTLTISSGAQMQFTHPEDGLIISGPMHARGIVSTTIGFQPMSGAVAGSWGQVAFQPGSSGVLDHVILEYGGSNNGMLYIASDAVQVLNSVIKDSVETGIYIQGASPLISATQILTNTSSLDGGGLYNDTGSPTIQNNTFLDNDALNGGAIYNGSGNPFIHNNTFASNYAQGTHNGGSGGGLYNDSGSPTVKGNIFKGNWTSTYNYQGGALFNNTGNPSILRNTFIGNFTFWGGGLYSQAGSPLIQNNIFTGNSGGEGGGIYIASSDPIIQTNTFFGNNSTDSGGGMCISSGSTIIRSNIIVNNSADHGAGISSTGTPVLSYNDVWNNTGGEIYGVTLGAHDTSAEPRLVDPANGDFHLSAGSPCIDAGDPVNYPPPTDFEGDVRLHGPAPDIGADEYYTQD